MGNHQKKKVKVGKKINKKLMKPLFLVVVRALKNNKGAASCSEERHGGDLLSQGHII